MEFEHYGPTVTEMPLHDAAMRVTEIKVCTGGVSDDLKGLSMTLSDPSLGTSSSVEVPMLGKEGGRHAECETVSVESGFRKIKVSMTIGGRFIDGI